MLKRLLLATAAMATLAGTTTVVNHPTNVAAAKVVHHKKHVAKLHVKKHVVKKRHAKKHAAKVSTKQLATMVYRYSNRNSISNSYVYSNYFSKATKVGKNYYGIGSGSSVGMVYFTKKGNTIIYKHLVNRHGEPTYLEKFKTFKVSYKKLIRLYYATKSQKNYTNKLVKHLM